MLSSSSVGGLILFNKANVRVSKVGMLREKAEAKDEKRKYNSKTKGGI